MNLLSDIKEKLQKQKEIKKHTSANPRFENIDISKVQFYPIDNDIDRMKLYGCYAGDKFIYQGKEYIVEKDDVEKVKFYPSYKEVTGKPVEWKQALNESKQRMYMGNFIPNDTIENGLYSFTYVSQDIIKETSIHGGEAIGHIDGWRIECIDKTTPIKDLIMPDSFLGIDVVSADDCFRNCYNVASVTYIPQKCFDYNCIRGMFTKSGIREIPSQLDTDIKIQLACGNALCLYNFENIIKKLNSYSLSYTAYGKVYNKEKSLLQAKEDFNRNENLLRSEFSPYQKFEKVSFEYDGKPLTIITAIDVQNTGFAINDTDFHKPILIPFKEYMQQLEGNKMSGFTKKSFSSYSYDEGVIAILNATKNKIQYLTKEFNTEKESLFQKIQEEVSKAIKAQQGLDLIPAGVSEENAQPQSLQQDTVVFDL